MNSYSWYVFVLILVLFFHSHMRLRLPLSPNFSRFSSLVKTKSKGILRARQKNYFCYRYFMIEFNELLLQYKLTRYQYALFPCKHLFYFSFCLFLSSLSFLSFIISFLTLSQQAKSPYLVQKIVWGHKF